MDALPQAPVPSGTVPLDRPDRRAVADAPLLPAIAARWSPRAFDPDRPLTEADLLPLLEAARWSASASNLQPRRLAWALRGEAAFDRILGCINPGNAPWAKNAGCLMVGCAVVEKPDGSGRNDYAAHDLGQALAQLSIQAAHAGIGVHQMGGFDREKARAALAVPPGTDPFTALALGWPAAPETLDEPYRSRETAPRARVPLAELAPRGGWGGGDDAP